MEHKPINVAQPFVGEEEVKAAAEVLRSGKYVSGRRVREFENAFAAYHGVEHGIAVNSGTAALHIALAVTGLQPGDEVIVPPLTFFSTVSAVLHQYGVPVFADIDPLSYCLDPADVERRITERTRAIIPVHLYGNAADMDPLMKIARKHKLIVIEDCAQAHGTEYKGGKVGTIGDIGAFSFFATKHMTTTEGGMLVTADEGWAEKARMIRSHGMSGRDDHIYLGYNYRMTEIAAAIGLVQLDKLDELNKRRIQHSLYLIDQLKEAKIPWLKVPHLYDHIRHTFFWCPIRIDEEKLGMTTKELAVRLKEAGIETRNRYWEPLYKQKILVEKENHPHRVNFTCNDRHIDYNALYLPHAEQIAGRLIGLPNHAGLTREQLDRVVSVFTKLFII
jgi:dTDP-4-amino-4,6-dideoxygalactose transaminase